jgi:hypothetical protein
MSLRTCILAGAAACLPAVTLAAGPQLELPAFEHLQQRATDAVNLSFGPSTLGLASHLLQDSDPADAGFAQLVRGLKGVYIRSYEFAADDAYPTEAVEAVRRQLAAPDWTRVTQVRSHGDGEQVDIYVCLVHGKMEGLALIASDHRRFTILNVVGSFDLRQLATLEHQFGLPALGR